MGIQLTSRMTFSLFSPLVLSSSVLARQGGRVAFSHSFFGPGSLSAIHSLRSLNRRPLYYESMTRLLDNEKNYHLIARLPGVSASSVDVKLSDGLLNLRATEPDNTDNVVFHRTWRLPEDANPSTLRAWCTDGVLEVKATKYQPLPPLQISVESLRPGDIAADDSNAYEISRLVPGVAAEDVNLQLTDSILSIKAEAKRGGYYTSRYVQNFILPKHSDAPSTRAWCENGVLTIHVPKQPAAAPFEIAVNPTPSISDGTTSEFHTLAVRRVPGYSNKDVKITVENEQCVVELQREGATVARERFSLPEKLVDPRTLDAVCENGVLTVQYPKTPLEEQIIHVSGQKPADEFDEGAPITNGETEHDDHNNGERLTAAL